MIDISADGDLFCATKHIRIFSDSYEKSFSMLLRFTKAFVVSFVVYDKTPFCDVRYCAIEINVSFMKDFFCTIDIGDFCFEVYNVAHHEE
jgi:hypothetical protein